jgi:hypothetical protein
MTMTDSCNRCTALSPSLGTFNVPPSLNHPAALLSLFNANYDGPSIVLRYLQLITACSFRFLHRILPCQLSISNVRLSFLTPASFGIVQFIALVLTFASFGTSASLRVLSNKSTLTERTSASEAQAHRTSIFGSLYQLASASGGIWHHQIPNPIPRSTSLHSFYGLVVVDHYFVSRANTCPRQPSTRYSSQQAQAASLLGLGSQFNNSKTSGNFDKDKNSTAVSMSQASQVCFLQHVR